MELEKLSLYSLRFPTVVEFIQYKQIDTSVKKCRKLERNRAGELEPGSGRKGTGRSLFKARELSHLVAQPHVGPLSKLPTPFLSLSHPHCS